MSILKVEKINILSADFGKESTLPPISETLSLNTISNEFRLDEDDGLFVNYGVMECAHPYKYQNMYNRDLKPTEYDCVILENEYIKATFMPKFGSKLWSLYDKKENRELLFKNSVVRPCNLAVRNAWLSGGIEWNCGYKGHGPYTCSTINTAITKLDDGTPVLRFYYFERIRCAIVQMDFFLPEDSSLLHCRMRITNPNDTVIPMYWWSNIATVENEGDRIVVPANETYIAERGMIEKIPVPHYNDSDLTYPSKNRYANDYFFKTEKDSQKYICQFGTDGYGLFQSSTDRLKGRKLFVWGDSQGGHKWKNFLTADNESGSYNEIQCGLAYTQHECLPMPPHTVWEWLEVYGPIKADEKKIHGTWAEARKEALCKIEEKITKTQLEEILKETHTMAISPADETIIYAEGWGALEAERRKGAKNMLCGHLDFGTPGKEQEQWQNLLYNGTLGKHNPTDVPTSYIRQSEWLKLMEQATENKDKNNWYTYFQLGCAYTATEDYSVAMDYFNKSLKLEKSPWAYYGKAIVCQKTEDKQGAVENIQKAYNMKSDDISMAKDLFKILFVNSEYSLVISYYEKASEEIKNNERCSIYYAYTLALTGRLKESEDILCGNGNLIIPDIRECETITSDLWFYIQSQKENPSEDLPRDLDFRMFVERDGK